MTPDTHCRDDAARAELVDSWRQRLATVRCLSQRYQDRYAVVFASLQDAAEPGAVAAAEKAVGTGNVRAGLATLTSAANDTLGRLRPCGERTASAPWHLTGPGPLVALVGELRTAEFDLDAYLDRQPWLEQTRVPLHPSRQARLVTLDGTELVALRWAPDSVSSRRAHELRMEPILTEASQVSPLPFAIQRTYVIARRADEDPWVFSPNLGLTLEDRLRQDDLGWVWLFWSDGADVGGRGGWFV